MRKLLALTAAALAAAVGSPGASRADEDLSIVIDPRTGAASLRNDSAAPIDLDGYLLRSGSDVFDPVAWTSLEEQSLPGWFDGPAAANRLADTNLLGSSSLAPGATLSLGAPYVPFSPSAIGEPEPSLDITYSVAGVGVFPGDVEFSRANNVVLEVNPNTGAASLVNQSAFNIDIDGYLITSEAGVLSVGGWSPLGSTDSSWAAAAGAANRLAEGNLLGSTPLASDGGELAIGSPIDPSLLTDETELTLRYNIPGVGQITGGVLFTSAAVVSIPGDYNGNGVVDAADYVIWRNGASPDSTQAGYDLWAGNYGSTSAPAFAGASSAAAIPEPVALVSLAACLAGVAIRRPSRRG